MRASPDQTRRNSLKKNLSRRRRRKRKKKSRLSSSPPTTMDDPFERRLRDEVVYLHSLWHLGPPHPPNPPLSDHPPSRAIPVSRPAPFKKPNSDAAQEKKKKKKKKKRQRKKRKDGEEPKQPENEWPCREEPIPQPYPAWPATKQKEPDSGQTSRPASAEEQAEIAGRVTQQRALERCRGLFARAGDSDGEEGEDDGDGDEMEDDRAEGDNGGLQESEEYKFLLDVFVKDEELREYYERNHESGDFWCFVCGAQGGKMSGRKFKNCCGVLQHSINISKTKKRRAHRAFGLVICRVMGWDVGRLPLIVKKGKRLSRSLPGPSLVQTVCEEDAATKSVENYDKEISIPGINGEGKVDGPTAAKEDDSLGIKNLNRENIDARADEEKLLQFSDSVPLPTSSAEWPCGNLVDSSATAESGWRPFKSLSSHSVLTEVKEESETWHQKVFQACHVFFRCRSGSESDGDEEADDEEENDDDEDEDDLLDGDVDGECEVIKFFMKLFMENAELKRYYESKYGDGDFCCLVCAGVGKKPWKRFKGCNGLLQHCTTIWKIKKLAHKAYARAICKVLNWDIDCLPPIKNTSEALGHSLVQSGDMQGGSTDKFFMSINCLDANDSVSSPVSSIKWPCESPVDRAGMAASEWPPFKSHLVSAEEKAEPETWHQKVLDGCQAFFNCMSGSDTDGDEEADDEEEDEGDKSEDVLHGDDDGECEIVKFFTVLFTENAELRSYYNGKYRDGDFGCLVCAGVGKKPWKRFKGCTGLLQHSTTIVKTKKRAHRAYGRAICKLLGWDINKFPSIANDLEALNQSSVQPADMLDNGTDTPTIDNATACQDIGAQVL
ncbi:uncharacterized protein LOC115666847 isoform X2 [Syzygium oleosum]|uniref:uncharacterized protein LOC115666847 isoform X2 n=1 Tax=Syzygium oleosum TaxID=219896 RepID=UPI0024B9DAC8|nr:uncharacterized protein LOC115666847 isoform X2 [Syzygium oleosum]